MRNPSKPISEPQFVYFFIVLKKTSWTNNRIASD